ARPIASAAPSVAAACMSKELDAAPPTCAKALLGRTTARIPTVVASIRLFVLNMTSSSLLMRPKTALLLAHRIFRIDAGNEGEETNQRSVEARKVEAGTSVP